MDQETGGWRQFDFQDKERIFAGITFRPVRTLTFQAMGETGHDASAVMKTFPPSDEFLAWYDHVKRLPGRVRFQVNISSLFDETDIIPVRMSTSANALDGFVLPGGRGVPYSRYDLVPPPEIRFTTTYSF